MTAPTLNAAGTEIDKALDVLLAGHDHNAYRVLRAVAERLGASVAYIDRATIEAHLGRALTGPEWVAIGARLRPMAFDDHVGDKGSLRTEWIGDLLALAGVSA